MIQQDISYLQWALPTYACISFILPSLKLEPNRDTMARPSNRALTIPEFPASSLLAHLIHSPAVHSLVTLASDSLLPFLPVPQAYPDLVGGLVCYFI